MLNLCIKEPHIHIAVFTILQDTTQSNKKAQLDFIQNMEYKLVELMNCSFQRSSDEYIQQQLSYRYNKMKQKLLMMTQKLHEITNIVKIKNPSLLLQIQKSNQNHMNMSGMNVSMISGNSHVVPMMNSSSYNEKRR
jgi:hypothetical protein